MCGQIGLVSLAGYSRGYNRRAEFVADVVLHDQYGTYAALLGADYGAEIGIVYISSFYGHLTFTLRINIIRPLCGRTLVLVFIGIFAPRGLF